MSILWPHFGHFWAANWLDQYRLPAERVSGSSLLMWGWTLSWVPSKSQYIDIRIPQIRCFFGVGACNLWFTSYCSTCNWILTPGGGWFGCWSRDLAASWIEGAAGHTLIHWIPLPLDSDQSSTCHLHGLNVFGTIVALVASVQIALGNLCATHSIEIYVLVRLRFLSSKVATGTQFPWHARSSLGASGGLYRLGPQPLFLLPLHHRAPTWAPYVCRPVVWGYLRMLCWHWDVRMWSRRQSTRSACRKPRKPRKPKLHFSEDWPT